MVVGVQIAVGRPGSFSSMALAAEQSNGFYFWALHRMAALTVCQGRAT